MMVLLAVVPQLIGQSLINWTVRFITATLITTANLGQPIVASVLAVLILNEVPTISEVGGSIMILAGIYIAFRKS